MMLNMGTRVATVNIVFSTSRNPALYERKVFQYATLSIQLHRCTLSEPKAQSYTISIVFACRKTLCGPEITLKAAFS